MVDIDTIAPLTTEPLFRDDGRAALLLRFADRPPIAIELDARLARQMTRALGKIAVFLASGTEPAE